ncbi:MAG TPA: Fic family protein [Candidatus Pacearchaeota archaeon]|nr:Fic family protein [Candidatus Pacearchaeota archaeon]HPR79638.1 Fic family protein [Candidatus Pacearchaeota archaeon]
MTISEKLKIIQKVSGLKQTEMAQKFGVSFATLNAWYNGKSKPRIDKQNLIGSFYLELTGQKQITEEYLKNKKEQIKERSKKHSNILKEIISSPDIKQEFILKLTYHSNKIEGSTLSEKETASIIFDNISFSKKTLSEQLEAKNHQTALNYLFDFILNKGEIDESLVLKLHSILMNGIINDAGRYRVHPVRILGTSVPTANYLKIPELISDLFNKKKNNDVIAFASEVHSSFEKIHPFSDGNGRVGRLLLTAILLRENLVPAVIKQGTKYLYYVYLEKSQLSDDFTQLQNFICDAINNGLDILERKY